MDFSFSEAQDEVRQLAARIFEGQATVERVKAAEASESRVDQALWSELAKSNLLGIALPEEYGGSGLGLTELCLVLEEQGRRVAPVPVLATVAGGALPIAEWGTDAQRQRWLPGVIAGDVVLTAALAEAGANDVLAPSVTATQAADGAGWRLDGVKVSVPAVHVAQAVLVPARLAGGDRASGDLGVFIVDLTSAPSGPGGASGVRMEQVHTTNREIQGHLHFEGAPAELLGDATQPGQDIVRWMLDRYLVGLCALQVGICEQAVRMAAEYTSNRFQFGRPLSTFQGAALKAADAYIDTEAMRATLWQAAWRLSEGADAVTEVGVAKWWAAEGGHRVVHVTQHLHGGMGADVDYPVHRYFLWAKQISDTLGGASQQLARLGEAIAEAAKRHERVGAGA